MLQILKRKHNYLTPSLPNNVSLTLNKKTENITFNCNNISTIIRSLYPNKVHGYDMISIRMLKIFDKSVCKPLKLIFKSCIKHGKFPNEWKLANAGPVHKKSDKQILKNYRPVSPLPICGNVFECLIYNREWLNFSKPIWF